MSELHVRQIKVALERHFKGLIDLRDVEKKNQNDVRNHFLSRAQMAFVLAYLAGVRPEVAAGAVTDGPADNGIDGVLYHASERILYLGQSKWRNDGTGSIDRGEMQRFIKGFRDLINARWTRFNDKIKGKSEEIEVALNDSTTRIVLVISYTGQEALSQEISQDLQDILDENNSPTALVTAQVMRQSSIYAAVAQGLQGSPIDLEIALYEWGHAREPYTAFYGQVSASDVARWYEQHQMRLFAPNIRMFLGSTDVNSTIAETLTSSPLDFWYFNNGISALARTVKKKPIGGSTRETGIFECRDVSVVNGAQTVGAIATAATKNPDAVATARVPIRIISLENCPPEFAKKVTRFNNTQNRIDRRDFVALDVEQERIRGELLFDSITYVYKSGETLTPSDKEFGLEEATVARACLQKDVSLAVQAKREIGKLWEDIERAPYKTLFNSSVSGPSIWRAVQIVREVEARLAVLRTNGQGRDRLLAVHGNRFITHLVFQRLSTRLDTLQSGLDATAREEITQATVEIYQDVLQMVNIEYPDAYLATLFKNAGKCQHLRKVLLGESESQ